MRKWRRRWRMGDQFQPRSVEEIRELLEQARTQGKTVVPRGAGCSSVDATRNPGGITIDLSRMRRLEWRSEQDIMWVEPGVTIGQLCQEALIHGQWPRVVPSTAYATLGGSLSLNAHGINAMSTNSIGQQVESFDLLLASGEHLQEVSRLNNDDLFFSAIGGLGMLGIITGIALPLRPIPSGVLQTYQFAASSLLDMFRIFTNEVPNVDYLVGWIDGYAEGDHLGRGIVMSSSFLEEPVPDPLPPTIGDRMADIAKILPPMGWALRPFLYSGGVRIANTIHYSLNSGYHGVHTRHAPLIRFLLHSNPCYFPLHSMHQIRGRFFQPFVSAAAAPEVFTRLLVRSQQEGLVPYRCILRQHQADSFTLSCQIDGFSLELSYCVASNKDAQLTRLLEEMRELVINAGGRLYLARDDVLDQQSYMRSMNERNIKRFRSIKGKYDNPDNPLFQSNLFRRLFSLRPDHESASSSQKQTR